MHDSDNGTVVSYTTCAGIDVHRPWCATEVNSTNGVVRWGLCLPDCPTIEPEVTVTISFRRQSCFSPLLLLFGRWPASKTQSSPSG